MLGQQAKGNHVMGFTATHGLRQQVGAGLVVPVFEALEGSLQQSLHTAGDKVFFKELFTINPILQQVGNIQYHIPAIAVEYTLSGLTGLAQEHGLWSFLKRTLVYFVGDKMG